MRAVRARRGQLGSAERAAEIEKGCGLWPGLARHDELTAVTELASAPLNLPVASWRFTAATAGTLGIGLAESRDRWAGEQALRASSH